MAEPANPIESLRADTQAADPVKTLRGLRRQDRRKLSEPVLGEVADVYEAGKATGAPHQGRA